MKKWGDVSRGWGFLIGACLFVFGTSGCAAYAYRMRTAPGPVRTIPGDYFGAAPGPISPDSLRRNGWALAETHEGTEVFVRGGSPDLGVSEAEAVVSAETDGARVDFVRLRYNQTRLATYKALVQSLIDKHGPPQTSDVRPSFDEFVIDPKSDRPRPPRVVVHRWHGLRADLVLVAGLEDEENLLSAMDYQLFLMPATTVPTKTAGK